MKYSIPLLAALLLAAPVRAAENVILDMDTIRHKPMEVEDKDKKKVPVGTAEFVEGKVGKAVRFTFTTGRGLFSGTVRPDASWDSSEGFSFWVKGDGSSSFGGIEFIDKSDYRLRYGYCFPIDSTEWVKITVPWVDVVPELAGKRVDGASGYKPSGFGNLWVGKWNYWREYPACSFALDQFVLEPEVEYDRTDYTVASAGLKRIAEKIRGKKPVTIVTMGDSLTDKRHGANAKSSWGEMLVDSLKQQGVAVTHVNPAIGGTTLSQNTVLIPRWIKEAPSPDLVVINFGFNDVVSNKVNGERFKEHLLLAIDRVRRETKGSADILVVTTCPGMKYWETFKDLEQAARDAAKEKQTGLADLAAEVRKLGTPEEVQKMGFWSGDNVHLGQKGKEVFRDVVLKAITTGR